MDMTYPGETRAISIAGMSLAYALAGILKRMGALAPEAVDDAFEAALSSVESAFAADDCSAALARQLLDVMGGQLATHVKPLGAPGEAEAAPASGNRRGLAKAGGATAALPRRDHALTVGARRVDPIKRRPVAGPRRLPETR